MKGQFIVIEGIDKSGKTTLSNLIKEKLLNEKEESQMTENDVIVMKFPERNTPVGQLIDKYLRKQITFNSQTIHLLFSANRWEINDYIKEMRKEHVLICDRYYYSGISYTKSKGVEGEWAEAPDKGLEEPDFIFFIDIKPSSVAKRQGFGDERYEVSSFLDKVYVTMKEYIKTKENHIILDGNSSLEEMAGEVVRCIIKK